MCLVCFLQKNAKTNTTDLVRCSFAKSNDDSHGKHSFHMFKVSYVDCSKFFLLQCKLTYNIECFNPYNHSVWSDPHISDSENAAILLINQCDAIPHFRLVECCNLSDQSLWSNPHISDTDNAANFLITHCDMIPTFQSRVWRPGCRCYWPGSSTACGSLVRPTTGAPGSSCWYVPTLAVWI